MTKQECDNGHDPITYDTVWFPTCPVCDLILDVAKKNRAVRKIEPLEREIKHCERRYRNLSRRFKKVRDLLVNAELYKEDDEEGCDEEL